VNFLPEAVFKEKRGLWDPELTITSPHKRKPEELEEELEEEL
jgi:hypothetical protein